MTTQALCSDHRHEQLLPAEKLALTVASAQADRGDSVPPNTATALLLTIDRLEHELAHAHWGGLECNRQSGALPGLTADSGRPA